MSTQTQDAECTERLQKEKRELVALLKKIRTRGEWYHSAIELDHDVNGMELREEVDALLEKIEAPTK